MTFSSQSTFIQLSPFGGYTSFAHIQVDSPQSSQCIIMIGERHNMVGDGTIVVEQLLAESDVPIDVLGELNYNKKDDTVTSSRTPSIYGGVSISQKLDLKYTNIYPNIRTKVYGRPQQLQSEQSLSYVHTAIMPYKGRLRIWAVDYRKYTFLNIIDIASFSQSFQLLIHIFSNYPSYKPRQINMHNIAQYDEYITALEKLQKNNKSKLQWSQLPLYKYGFLTFIVILTYVKNFINKIKCIYYALLGFEHLSTQTRRTTVQLRKIPKETIQELIRRYLQEIYDKTLDDIRLEPSQGETSDKVNERKKTILDSILNAHFKYTRKINLFDSLSPDSKHFRMYDYYRYLPEFVQGSIHQIIEGYTDDILIYNSFFLDFFLLYRLFQLIQRNQTRYIPIFIGDSHFEIIQNTLLSLLNPNLEFDWDRNRFTISKVFEHKQPKYGIPPQIPLRIPRLIRNPSNNQTTPYIDQYKRRLQLDKIQTQQQQQKKRKQQQQSQPLTATI